MSSDQNLTMALHLRGKAHALAPSDPKRMGVWERAKFFLSLAMRARDEDWPSSATMPFQILTDKESESAWNDPPTRQRVFAPYLTPTELEALRLSNKETSEYARKVFAHLRPSAAARGTRKIVERG